jgi:hypothetical protein
MSLSTSPGIIVHSKLRADRVFVQVPSGDDLPSVLDVYDRLVWMGNQRASAAVVDRTGRILLADQLWYGRWGNSVSNYPFDWLVNIAKIFLAVSFPTLWMHTQIMLQKLLHRSSRVLP